MPYVQFSDSTETKIVTEFGCPQDAVAYPNQAQIADSDPRYQAFINPAPTPATIANAALAAGFAITSTGTPAINGTYPVDVHTTNEIVSVITFIQINEDFPGGASVYPWFDTSGAAHIFPSMDVFKEWSTAIANYVAALKLYAAGAPGATLPAASVTIA